MANPFGDFISEGMSKRDTAWLELGDEDLGNADLLDAVMELRGNIPVQDIPTEPLDRYLIACVLETAPGTPEEAMIRLMYFLDGMMQRRGGSDEAGAVV